MIEFKKMFNQKLKIMKKIVTTIVMVIFAIITFAQTTTTVKPYYKKDGTYVSGYTKTTPDCTKANNYSTKPNTNPNTGKSGTVTPVYMINPSYSKPTTPSYPTYNNKTVYTGSKGGKYYINSNGNKTYIK